MQKKIRLWRAGVGGGGGGAAYNTNRENAISTERVFCIYKLYTESK